MANPVKPIPDGFHSITPYMVVSGAAKLMEFLRQAFQATEIYRHAEPDGTVRHAEMRIGDSAVMLGEAPEGKSKPAYLYLYIEDVDTVYQRAVAAGGKSLGEPTNHFYGDRSAGIEDPSGNTWWIATHIEDVSSEELTRRMAAARKT